MEDSLPTTETEILLQKLQDLEDTYAQCLADEVDATTLNQIWLEIKLIKAALASRPNNLGL
jgi:hypothetical protein